MMTPTLTEAETPQLETQNQVEYLLEYIEELEYPESDGEPMTESDPTRDYLIYGVEALNLYFADQPDIYVSGNLFIYYEKGVRDAVVSPDVFVVKGVEKKPRRTYLVWKEGGKTPNFVLEITSKKTKMTDEKVKPVTYALMGVEEYFQYDPTGDYLKPALKGKRLVNGRYKAIPKRVLEDGTVAIFSEELGLELRLLENGELQFFDRQKGVHLLKGKEVHQALQQAEAERQQEAQARLQAEAERQQEAQARLQAEAELQATLEARQASISRLLTLGLSIEQIATALALPMDEIE